MLKRTTPLVLLFLMIGGCVPFMPFVAFKTADTALKMSYEWSKEHVCSDHGGFSKAYRTEVTDHRGTGIVGMVACADGTQFELISWHYDRPIYLD